MLDTNVVVSAAISPQSVPARIIDAWGQGKFDLILSPPLLAEGHTALLRTSEYVSATTRVNARSTLSFRITRYVAYSSIPTST
jgi:predicted nucleic acid-binding protein